MAMVLASTQEERRLVASRCMLALKSCDEVHVHPADHISMLGAAILLAGHDDGVTLQTQRGSALGRETASFVVLIVGSQVYVAQEWSGVRGHGKRCGGSLRVYPTLGEAVNEGLNRENSEALILATDNWAVQIAAYAMQRFEPAAVVAPTGERAIALRVENVVES